MEKSTFKLSPKASVSLASLVGRAERRLRPALAALAAGIGDRLRRGAARGGAAPRS